MNGTGRLEMGAGNFGVCTRRSKSLGRSQKIAENIMVLSEMLDVFVVLRPESNLKRHCEAPEDCLYEVVPRMTAADPRRLIEMARRLEQDRLSLARLGRSTRINPSRFARDQQPVNSYPFRKAF